MVFRRRRFVRRRKVVRRPRSRFVRRRGMALRRGGAISIRRRCPEVLLQNTSVAGTVYCSSQGSGPMVSGTPLVASFSGYYNIPLVGTFKLSDVINYSDITQLCDNYKLKWVKIKIWSTSTTASAGSTAQLPSILYRVDSDDSAQPTTIDSLREDMNSQTRVFYPGKPVTIFLRPKAQIRNDQTPSGAQGGPIIVPAKWVNSSYPNSVHYGIKMFIQDANLTSTTNANTQFKFDITYGIAGKDIQ